MSSLPVLYHPAGDAVAAFGTQVAQAELGQPALVRRLENYSERATVTWSVTWRSVAAGFVKQLQQVYLAGGQGAGLIEWTNPMGEDVYARFITFSYRRLTAQGFEVTAEIEEALEPC